MKMVMPLLAPAAGKVNFQQLEGALLIPGNLIARLDLDNPEAVQVPPPPFPAQACIHPHICNDLGGLKI